MSAAIPYTRAANVTPRDTLISVIQELIRAADEFIAAYTSRFVSRGWIIFRLPVQK